MDFPDTVVWFGRHESWRSVFGGSVRDVETPNAAVAASDGADLVVLDGASVAALTDWLRRPLRRPPALVVTDSEERAEAALRAGADEVVRMDATEADARRAVRRAYARHEAARSEAERYRLMVESVPHLIAIVDAAWRYVYVSRGAEEQTGYAPDDLIGESVFEHLHPDDVEAVAQEFAAGLREPGAVRSLRFRARAKDGSLRFMEGTGRVVTESDGAPYGVVAARDVTERKLTEDQLLASEVRYRTVVRALPDVVSRLRLDGYVLDFHVPSAFKTEFPAEAMIGRPLPDVIPPDLAQKYLAAVAEMRATGEPVSYDYRVEVGGEEQHREVRMAPMGEDEILSMIRDVTDLRRHQIALEASQAELRALAVHLQRVREDERARLSREVHDVLGQQLTAIRLGVGWFGRHYPDDEAIQSRVQDVRAVIDETIRHVREIATTLRPGVLDDFGLPSAVEWQAQRFKEQTGVPCRVDIQGDHAPAADVATAAFRVLQEALTNVARHADARTVTVSLMLTPDHVRLTVADDGRGMDPEKASRRRTLGLLGMTERANALGGTLTVSSQPGEGTTVECTFPLQSAASPSLDSAAL